MSIDEVVDGLFEQQVVATPADDTVQWRASLLQLVNWGGFGGLTTVPLAGDSTMISGASGVGVEELIDIFMDFETGLAERQTEAGAPLLAA